MTRKGMRSKRNFHIKVTSIPGDEDLWWSQRGDRQDDCSSTFTCVVYSLESFWTRHFPLGVEGYSPASFPSGLIRWKLMQTPNITEKSFLKILVDLNVPRWPTDDLVLTSTTKTLHCCVLSLKSEKSTGDKIDKGYANLALVWIEQLYFLVIE